MSNKEEKTRKYKNHLLPEKNIKRQKHALEKNELYKNKLWA